MKRTEMRSKIAALLEKHKNNCCGPHDVARYVLELVEEAGMLPPTQTCKLIEDTVRGGLKHGPSERVWDEE